MSCKEETTVYLVRYRWMKLAFTDVNEAFKAYQAVSAAKYVDDAYFGPDSKNALFYDPQFSITMETIPGDKIYQSKIHAEEAHCPTDKPDNLNDDEAVAA